MSDENENGPVGQKKKGEYKMSKIITGWDAIEAKRNNPKMKLSTYNNPIEDAQDDISIEYAEDVARDDPGLVWAEVPGKEYAVVMDCPRHWTVVEFEEGDEQTWGNISGIFSKREKAEHYCHILNL